MDEPLTVPAKKRIWEKLCAQWKPKEIQPPQVDPALPDLSGIERSAEVTRYSMLSFEWWLSPNGTLREWLRLHSKLGCFLLIPALFLFPVITLLFGQLAGWMTSLVSIATNFILFPIAALLALVVGLFVLAVIRTILGK